MKNSLPYYLTWIGLSGVIASQIIILLNQSVFSLWTGFVLLTALLPIKGFIQNTHYTFQWSGFLSMFFLCVGVSDFFVVANTSSTSFILLCSSIVLYFGVVFHARKLAYYAALEKS